MSQVAFLYGGNTYNLATWDAADHFHAELAARNTFVGLQVLEFIRRRNLRGVYMDIGAGIGNYTIYFANECTPSLVVSCEGNTAVAPLLADNIRRNNHRRVPVWLNSKFITDRPKVYFNRATKADIGSSFLSEVPIAEASEPVGGLSLDDIYLHFPRVDLLTIDTENHELEVLKSAIQLLRFHRPEICVKTDSHSFPTVARFLAGAGYILIREFSDTNRYFLPVSRPMAFLDAQLLRLPESTHYRVSSHFHQFMSAWQWLTYRRRPTPAPRTPAPDMKQI